MPTITGAYPSLFELTGTVVKAYLANPNHNVDKRELGPLVASVMQAFATVGTAAAPAKPLNPAVPIRRSITPEYLICLEDGRKLKLLKRHLRTVYQMTPDEYRERWSLPPDYPMIAPNYSVKRSSLAKIAGLGLSPRARRAMR